LRTGQDNLLPSFFGVNQEGPHCHQPINSEEQQFIPPTSIAITTPNANVTNSAQHSRFPADPSHYSASANSHYYQQQQESHQQGYLYEQNNYPRQYAQLGQQFPSNCANCYQNSEICNSILQRQEGE
jgi:hypothetical protein